MGILCFGASSALMCWEDKNIILEDEQEEVVEVAPTPSMDFLGGVGFPLETDEVIRMLMEKEGEHLPNGDYLETLRNGGLKSSWRSDAIDWICKVQSYHNFGPLCVYLSVNYLDRFLSSYELPHGKAWIPQLLSVACLSLAVKMEENLVPLPLDLQVCGAKYVFEARTIKRMELLVLSNLKWRMQAVTPFSFISYFVDKFNEGKPLSNALVSRCVELIVGTLKGAGFLQFKPSEIATAVSLLAIAETRVLDFSNALAAHEIPVNKERVRSCHEVMLEKPLVKNSGTSPSVPQSPIGVMDAACFSFRSDNTTLGSSHSNNGRSNTNQTYTPASKRRRPGTPI